MLSHFEPGAKIYKFVTLRIIGPYQYKSARPGGSERGLGGWGLAYDGARTFQGVGGQVWYLSKKPPTKMAYSEKAFLNRTYIKKPTKKLSFSKKDFRIQIVPL